MKKRTQTERVFESLKTSGPITCHDLSAQFGIGKVAMTNSLSRLRAQGVAICCGQGGGYLWHAVGDEYLVDRTGRDVSHIIDPPIQRKGAIPIPVATTELEKAWGWFPCA